MCCQLVALLLDTDLCRLLTASAHLGLACRILHTLRVRYTLDMIYTYSGNILIAVSPAPGEQVACARRQRGWSEGACHHAILLLSPFA